MAKVLVSERTNGYQMKEGDLLYSLVPCTSKSGQGFTNSSRSKSSSFLNGPDNYYSDLISDNRELTTYIDHGVRAFSLTNRYDKKTF